MFRLHVSLLGSRGSSVGSRVMEKTPPTFRPARVWQPQMFLKPKSASPAVSAEAAAHHRKASSRVDSRDARRMLTETDRRFKAVGKVLSAFVRQVLGYEEGYERYLKREAERLRSLGQPWIRMTTKTLRDQIRAKLTADLNDRYLRGERTVWFVRASYRGNPVRVYRDMHNREFVFILDPERPEVIGVFTMRRFLNTDRRRAARRKSMMRPSSSASSAN